MVGCELGQLVGWSVGQVVHWVGLLVRQLVSRLLGWFEESVVQ